VTEGNLNVAMRAADQIGLYVDHGVAILTALAQNIGQPDLRDWQRERIVKSYLLQMKEFRKIELLDREGRQIVTTEVGVPLKERAATKAFQTALQGSVYRSGIFISDDLVPTMTLAVPMKRMNEVVGVLVGDVEMTRMWQLVDSIRIGKTGYAFVVSESGELIAHGLGEGKARVLRHENAGGEEIVKAALMGNPVGRVYRASSEDVIGVGVPIPSLGWGLIIEQPTREAFAPIRRMTLELSLLVLCFLGLMALMGYWGGRRYMMEPIRALMAGTHRVASGNLDEAVLISSKDEFQALGDAFNTMTSRLKKLQEEVRVQERLAFFGKIAAGLVHDLKHPVRNIENTSRLLLRKFEDREVRTLFRTVVEKELQNINRFLEDLHYLTYPMALQPVRLNVSRVVSETAELFRKEAEGDEILMIIEHPEPPVWIGADRFALERVLKNLIVNAIEAMPKGGTLRLSVGIEQTGAVIRISDTGYGISPARLRLLFAEFATTKRAGLGLGLALSKKIITELHGTIHVESELNQGTLFTLMFPQTTVEEREAVHEDVQ
ncbi:MAG: HAMP domain-containing protein, partial [Nitrospirae bacterium]|nr:HAMP domain-containing protein [Nitrospirota bacterium]